MRVFISGPLFSSGRVPDNVRKAVEAADELMDLGYHPYVPHLSVYADSIRPRSEADWVALDIAWLEQCDAVLRLPGHSVYGDKEVEHAKKLFIPVVYSIEELKKL